jgi:hypothetical protein
VKKKVKRQKINKEDDDEERGRKGDAKDMSSMMSDMDGVLNGCAFDHEFLVTPQDFSSGSGITAEVLEQPHIAMHSYSYVSEHENILSEVRHICLHTC